MFIQYKYWSHVGHYNKYVVTAGMLIHDADNKTICYCHAINCSLNNSKRYTVVNIKLVSEPACLLHIVNIWIELVFFDELCSKFVTLDAKLMSYDLILVAIMVGRYLIDSCDYKPCCLQLMRCFLLLTLRYDGDWPVWRAFYQNSLAGQNSNMFVLTNNNC